MARQRERSRGEGFMIGAFIALCILTVGQFIDSRLEDARQYDRLEQVQEDLTTTLDGSTAQTRALIEQVQAEGREPVVDPSQVPDPSDVVKNGAPKPSELLPIPGPKGDPGPPPTFEQIQAAVDSYCSRFDCKPAPTAGQVARAMADYCNAKGECRGADGTNGTDGADGEDGKEGPRGAQGDPGPPPTPEQILSAVTQYCSAGACAGTTTVTLANCDPEAGQVVTGIQQSGDPKNGYVLTCSKAVDLVAGNGNQP